MVNLLVLVHCKKNSHVLTLSLVYSVDNLLVLVHCKKNSHVLTLSLAYSVVNLLVLVHCKKNSHAITLSLVYSVADLLVLVICCPNGMIEMYMRRVSTSIWTLYNILQHFIPYILISGTIEQSFLAVFRKK